MLIGNIIVGIVLLVISALIKSFVQIMSIRLDNMYVPEIDELSELKVIDTDELDGESEFIQTEDDFADTIDQFYRDQFDIAKGARDSCAIISKIVSVVVIAYFVWNVNFSFHQETLQEQAKIIFNILAAFFLLREILNTCLVFLFKRFGELQ
jgi:hypothetical protein